MDNQDKNLFHVPDTIYREKPVVVEVHPEPAAPVEQAVPQDPAMVVREEIGELYLQRQNALFSPDLRKEKESPELAEVFMFQTTVVRRLNSLRAQWLHEAREHTQRGTLTSEAIRKLLHSVGVEADTPSAEAELLDREKAASMSLFKKQQTHHTKASFFMDYENRFHYAVEDVKAKKDELPLLMLSYDIHPGGDRKTIAERDRVNFVENISRDELRRLNDTIAGYYQNVTRDVYHAPDYLAPPALKDEDVVGQKIADHAAPRKDDLDLAA